LPVRRGKSIRLKIVIVEFPSTRTGTRAVRIPVILEALKLRENALERQFYFHRGRICFT
jgi:hypothetical protein